MKFLALLSFLIISYLWVFIGFAVLDESGADLNNRKSLRKNLTLLGIILILPMFGINAFFGLLKSTKGLFIKND